MGDLKGFWISLALYNDKNLTLSEKFILTEIANLDKLDGCFAKNSHFEELFGFGKNTVHRAIKKMKDLGYISVELSNRNHTRLIRIELTQNGDNTTSELTQNGVKPYTQNGVKPYTQNGVETIGNKTLKQNNINITSVCVSEEHSFSFTLKTKTSYDNLTDEYRDKLYYACMLVDGKKDRYDDFIITLQANGYKYKNFKLAYMNWDKERAYKNFNPPTVEELGEDWKQVIISNEEIIAINAKTLDYKVGKRK